MFTTLRKAAVGFIMSVCLSVCISVRMEQLGFHWTDFNETWYLHVSQKSVKKLQVSLKSKGLKGTLHEDIYKR
jgi:hypothetical protein